MPSTNRVTVALRPREGETLDGLQFYARLGAPVSIGRALGVIVSATEGDAVDRYHELEAQLVLAESALAKSKAIHAPWTDVQVLDFLSVAMRHVVIEGDLKYSDINDVLQYMANKNKPAFVPHFNVDDHVRMAADARRYRWLKACEFEQANNLIVDVSEDDWDAKIDDAIRLQALEAEPCEQ